MKFEDKITQHRLPSTTDSIDKVEQLIDLYREENDIPEVLYGNCLIAVTEAISNAVKHGNKFNADKEVILSFEFDRHDLIVVVEDEGEGFDYQNLADPTAAENIQKLQGRGIFILKNLCDKVIFEEGGRKIIMHFNH